VKLCPAKVKCNYRSLTLFAVSLGSHQLPFILGRVAGGQHDARAKRVCINHGSMLMSQYWCVQVEKVLSCHEVMLAVL